VLSFSINKRCSFRLTKTDGVAEEIFQRDTFQEITFEQYQAYIDQKIIP